MAAPDDRTAVLWLTKGLGPGGAERLLLSFAQLVDHERFRIHAAYLLPWKDHLVADLEQRHVEVTCLDAPNPVDPRWWGRLRSLLRREQIQVIHDHSPLVAAQARMVARTVRPRPALVTTEHNVWDSHRGPTRVVNRLSIARDDHVFAVSDEVAGSMSGHPEVLVHGVDLDAIAARRSERAAARAELGLADDQVAVVTVANLRANKDYPNLLAAAARVVDGRGQVRFFAVGQGPLATDLASEAEALGLRDRFTFLGYRADPIRTLVAADVFVLASRYEGLPIAMLEAMAVGLPVVATSVGGVPSIIRDGTEGRLVPAGDPEALAAELVAALDPAVRSSLAAGARSRAADYGIERAVRRQEAVYAQLAGARSV